MAKIFHTTVDSMLNLSQRTVVDITDLSPKEQQVILNLVDCLSTQSNSDEKT